MRLRKTIPTMASGMLSLDRLALHIIMEKKRDFYIALSDAERLPYR